MTQNAKGQRGWEVKVYDDHPKDQSDKLSLYIEIAEARRKEGSE